MKKKPLNMLKNPIFCLGVEFKKNYAVLKMTFRRVNNMVDKNR